MDWDWGWLLGILTATIRQATPLLFAAMGTLFIQSSGIMNMGGEGQMLIAGFLGALITNSTDSVWAGMVVATFATAIISVMYVFIIQEFNVNQIIVGISFNTFVIALTTILNSGAVRGGGPMQRILPSFLVRPLGFPIPVFVGFLLVPLTAWFIRNSRIGLKIRAAGEYPLAVESVGLSVKRTRYIAAFIGGLFIGFAGAFLTLGINNMFIDNFVAGRGYISMTTVSFGKYSPFGILGAVILFGAGDALQFRLQILGDFPYQFAAMLPYVLTVIALVIFTRNPRSPSALGRPYWKQK